MKNFLNAEYPNLKPLFLMYAVSIILVSLRMKLSQDLHYLFLVWNLFLAIIPLIFAYLLREKKDVLLKPVLFLGFMGWLLFLPNAPYILTDFIHLNYSPKNWFAFDLVMILSFALSGLFSGLLSIKIMQEAFLHNIDPKIKHFAQSLLFMLCAYGVYLGRFWRYNSWHIVTHPTTLLKNCMATLAHPAQYWQLWIFTLAFGTLLHVISFFTFTFWYRQEKLSHYV